MMQVWGKVTKNGCKIINPDSDKAYLRFYLLTPYRVNSSSIISVNWWHWDWEPKPGEFVKATGFFEAVDMGTRTFMNVYIYGNVHVDDPWQVVPGVKAQKSPNWSEYPFYQKSSKKALTDKPDDLS